MAAPSTTWVPMRVRGLVVGRNLLCPPGDDVAAAVDTAVSLL